MAILARQGASLLSIDIAGIDASATTEASAALGEVSFATANTAGDVYASPGASCAFWFPGGNQGVFEGRIWANFRCDEVALAGSSCALDESSFIFENCGP